MAAMNVRQLAEKIHLEYAADPPLDSRWVEALLSEALAEAFENGVKNHERGGYTLKDIWDAVAKAHASAFEEAAKIAEQAKIEEWSDGGKTCTVWDLSKEGQEIANLIRLRAGELK